MIDQLIGNLQSDIALLKLRISQRQRTGLTDMPRLVEALAIKIFDTIEDASFSNLNLIKANYPAVDIADKKKRIAIQVTLKVDTIKAKKTVAAFETAGFLKFYDKLYLFGIEKAGRPALPSYCTALDINDVVNRLLDIGNEEKVQIILDSLRQHVDYSSLHPWEDLKCLEIVLHCIDRNAIKHSMRCEGSAHEMKSGLNEITEIISKGSVNRREKCKSIAEYRDLEIIAFLRSVRNHISDILVIINSNKQVNSDFICIDRNEMQKIDRLKNRIIDESMDIATKKGIKLNLHFRH